MAKSLPIIFKRYQNLIGYLLLVIFLILGFILRFYKLTAIPPGFSWDEASVGYNAYSLFKTGKDEFGQSWPIFMEAFGEYKTGLYSWLLVPVIRYLGLSIFTVRLPNVIFGTLTILASFYLALKIFKSPLETSFVAALVAVSPWAVHLSRFTLEWYFGFPLLLFGLGFLWEERKKKFFIFLAALFLSLSFYSYHAFRFLIPFLVIGFLFLNKKRFFDQKKALFFSLILSLLILLPLFKAMVSQEWFSRPKSVLLFTDKVERDLLMEGMYRHVKLNLPLIRVFNNKVVFYGKEALDRYLSHYSPQFLFLGEDVTPRIGVKRVGKLYLISFPFLLIGLNQLIRKKTITNRFLLFWLIIAPLPSSLTVDAPHALRSLLLVPVLQIITVMGLVCSYSFIKTKRPSLKTPFIFFVTIFYLSGLAYFLWQYWLFYPEDAAGYWQTGHQQMVEKVKQEKDKFETIVVTTAYGQPHIFFAFFTPIEPKKYQNLVNLPDQKGIFNARIPHLDKIEFRAIEEEDFCLENTLVVTPKSSNKELPRYDQVKIAHRFHEEPVIFEMFDTNDPLIRQTFCQSEN